MNVPAAQKLLPPRHRGKLRQSSQPRQLRPLPLLLIRMPHSLPPRTIGFMGGSLLSLPSC
jgi:hypothetical protein